MADDLRQGRRRRSVKAITKPGDYCLTDGGATLWFMLPTARDEGEPGEVRGLVRITQPPWTFTEFEDGSVEVRASIAVKRHDGKANAWHGFLDRGHSWRRVRP